MTKKFLKAASLSTLLFLLFALTSSAQSIVTGGIAGTVTDPTGAVVAGANLTLTNPATGEMFNATSSATGLVFALLKPEQYTLKIAKEGFKSTTESVTVVLGTTVTVNPALEIGSSSTTVEVNADTGAQLQTENANISTSYDIKQIQEVPNPGISPTLLRLLPV